MSRSGLPGRLVLLSLALCFANSWPQDFVFFQEDITPQPLICLPKRPVCRPSALFGFLSYCIPSIFSLRTGSLRLGQDFGLFWRNGGGVLFFGWFLLRLKDCVLEYLMKQRAIQEPASQREFNAGVVKIWDHRHWNHRPDSLNDYTGMSLSAVLAFGGVGGLALAIASQETSSLIFLVGS